MLSPPIKVAEPVPRVFRVSMSPDETVVSIGSSIASIVDGQSARYSGRIYDMLTSRYETETGTQKILQARNWETEISGSRVGLRLDGLDVVDMQLEGAL